MITSWNLKLRPEPQLRAGAVQREPRPENFAAIVINSISSGSSWDYSLRLNGTLNEHGNDGFLREGGNVQNFEDP